MIYNEKTLGDKLRELYDNAPRNEQVAMIHLFGIRYGEIILSLNIKIADIVKCSGISETYKTEVNKAVKLAKYVNIKESILQKYFQEEL